MAHLETISIYHTLGHWALGNFNTLFLFMHEKGEGQHNSKQNKEVLSAAIM